MEKQNRVRERWLSTRPKKFMQKSLRNVPDLAKRAEVFYLSERWPDAANDTIKGCTSVSVNDSVCVVVCVCFRLQDFSLLTVPTIMRQWFLSVRLLGF